MTSATDVRPEPPDESAPDDSASGSLIGRFLNVFAAPAETFDELRSLPPRHLHWLLPVLLSCLTGVLFSVVVFNQPDIIATLQQQQAEQFDRQVELGKMTRAQADQAIETSRNWMTPTVMMIFGSIGATAASLFMFFLVSSLMWLLMAKFLKGELTFLRAMEVTGLAGLINVLGGLVTLFLVLLRKDLNTSPGPILLIGEFDPTSLLHQSLGALNVFTLWFLAVLALGASRLTGRSFATPAAWVFGFWLVVRTLLVLVSWKFAS